MSAVEAKALQYIPTIPAAESSISLDLLITISAGRIEALSDLVNAREPNEERAFARTTIREMWRPVFGLAYREQLGLSTTTTDTRESE